MTSITIIVRGEAVPQGSTRAFVVKGRAVTTNKTPDLVAWRNLVAQEANREMAKESLPLLSGALRLRADFLFLRPKSHKKNELHVVVKPDLDKLIRAVMDALTGIVYRDDSQVAFIECSKTYSLDAGAIIWVEKLNVPTDDMRSMNTIDLYQAVRSTPNASILQYN